ncbi:MerR family transcriptional regulator [Limosilactobacillus avium]|uniref:MerR family transcriptional regulator n=1 Tax=Limosilactobacillus avium TaxID=2991831 RepID=UPI0024B91460|nr:MerR family transcriptional regulator [Limosilactobacillus avium]
MDIRQAAAELAVSPDRIRSWEQHHLIPPIKRDKAGFRQITKNDLDWMHLVKAMEQPDLSIDFLNEYSQLFTLGVAARPARKDFVNCKCHELQKKSAALIRLLKHIESLAE